MNRPDWMGLLARAPALALAERLDQAVPDAPAYTWLRRPETGAVMVQGRQGGTGAPFNLGEMSVTRCALRLPSGEVGHAYVQGRDKRHAERAALVDALMQTDRGPLVTDTVLLPLQRALDAANAVRAAKAAATKVDFFTLVRGED